MVGLEHSQHQIVYIESVVASYQVRAVKGDDAIAVWLLFGIYVECRYDVFKVSHVG